MSGSLPDIFYYSNTISMNKVIISIIFLSLVSCESELPDSSRLTMTYFLNQEELFASNNDGILYKSYDSGESWKEVFKDPSFKFNDMNFLNDTIGIISSENGQIYKSTDQGENWDRIDISLNQKASISISNGVFFTHSEAGQLFLSRDSLKSWQELFTPQNVDIKSAYIDDRNYIWLGTINNSNGNGTVFFTRDDGEYWFPSFETENEINFVTGTGQSIVAGGEDRIIYSNNRGDSWNTIWELETIQQDSTRIYSSKVSYINSFSRNGSTIVVGGLYFGNQPTVLVSRDNGLNWYDAYPQNRVSFGGRINSISVISQLNIGISGTAFTALMSSNAGYEWQTIDLNGIRQ